MTKVIRTDSKNNDFQKVDVLKRNRKKRSKNNAFFVEGAKSINNAVENGWKIETFIYAYEASLSHWAKALLEKAEADLHLELSTSLMEALSDKEEGTELLAVVSIPKDDLSRLPVHKDMIIVIFDRPSNYGNLGTLIRTCEALKVDGIIISGHAVDLYDTRTIRASLGTFFSVPIIRVDSPEEVAAWVKTVKLKEKDFKVIASTAKTEVSVDEADLSKGLALMIGNETMGLSHRFKEMSDEMVKIPMYGQITSFNVACAASIMIYEIERQRRSK